MTYLEQGAGWTRRRRPCGAAAVVCALLGLAPSVAAGQQPAAPSAAEAASSRLAIPAPDLSALPAPARRHAGELRRTLLAALADPAAPPDTVAGGFAVLGQLYQAYDLAGAAERSFDAALTLEPGNADLLHRRGLARRDGGDHPGAAADFRAVVAVAPERVAAWLQLGEALLAAGEPEGAAEAFARAEELGARAAAEHGLGRAALAAGDPAAAVEHLQAAISLQPSATAGHADLARAFAALGDEERAARHRARAGAGRFTFPDPVVEELRRLRTFTSFQAVREMAAEPSDDFDEEGFVAFLLTELGGVDGTLDRLRAALAEIERGAAAAGGEEAPAAAAGARTAERARLRLGTGALLLHQGRRDEAIGELREAVALAPELDHARMQLAGALAQEGRFAEAVAQFDRVLAADPGNAAALTRRAASRLRLGRRDAARRDVESALAVAADAETRAAAHALAAGMALDDGRPEAAVEHFRRALEADPGHPDALRGQGLLLGRLGRYREAAEVLSRLVALAPEDGGARDAEAVALILAGDEAAARERLEAGVAALPDDPRLAGRLARLLAAASDRSLRDGARAVELALEVFAVEPTADHVETLAMAYAEAGEFEQAVTWQERLLAADGVAEPDRARQRRHLALYRSGRSCCGDAPSTDPGGTR